MSAWLYALLCVVVPAAWALALVYVLRRRRNKPRGGPPPVDYSI